MIPIQTKQTMNRKNNLPPFIAKKPDDDRIMRGGPIMPNAALQAHYAHALLNLCAQMIDQTEREIKKLYKTETAQEFYAQDASFSIQAKILTNSLLKRFELLFGKKAKILALEMVDNANKTSFGNVKSSIQQLTDTISLSPDHIPQNIRDIMSASVTNNVGLIKSIQSQYHTQIQSAVMRSILEGRGLHELLPEIQKLGQTSAKRAKLIARDQTRKAYNALSYARMKNLNVREFEWRHSHGDKEPRPLHLAMNGKIYSFDDPPVIQYAEGGKPEIRGLPGDLINCTCFAVPVIKFQTNRED